MRRAGETNMAADTFGGLRKVTERCPPARERERESEDEETRMICMVGYPC